jgi:transglutaminase-like putative cysteine protease
MVNIKLISGVFILISFASTNAHASPGDEAPNWLRQAASQKLPTYDRTVSAVVLVDESTVTVAEDGRVTTQYSYAVRILSREGRESAVAQEGYATDTGKVKEMRAWLIQPSGQIKSYDSDDVIDEAVALNDVYNESRVKKISAVNDVQPGAVFGYQTVSESRPFFHEAVWYFQTGEPVISSKLTLVLPPGWQVKSTIFNHGNLQPQINGASQTWELRDLPPIQDEPNSPSLRNIAPRIAIKYFPGEGAKNPGVRAFEDWTDVSRWYSELSDPQAVPDEKIAAKARELTAAAKTEFERIRAIGRYVQNIQYISIQIGVGRLRPHPANEVFAKSYGDCKDKANLMRAMLKTLNIQAYPVLIFSGDRTFVNQEWVSPGQFNHCIIAIKVSDETQAPTVITLPKIGRLLVFDATDPQTPVGDLPDHEQGSFALVAAVDAGTLVKMPETPPEANGVERQIDATVSAEGLLTAAVRERAVGQFAARYRREFEDLSRPDYVKRIEAWVTEGAAAAKVSKVDPLDLSNEGRFDLAVDFSATAYAQLMQGRLLVFKPAVVARRESLFLTDSTRKYPVLLRSRAFSETVRFKLPPGFEVDELPDPVVLDAPFGSYRTNYEMKNGELVFTRVLSQRAGSIPAEQYQLVRGFYERIRAAEQAPVVLAKK